MGNAIVAVIPAFNESERIAATVSAVKKISDVSIVLVVDDGSTDSTRHVALKAGARCLRLDRNSGKGEAVTAGVTALRHWQLIEGAETPGALLLADADLGASAAHLGALTERVVAGELDLAIADLPPQKGAAGFGVAMWIARRTIKRHTGEDVIEPLSGQRAIGWQALSLLTPFACGFSIEVAMTIDALCAGLRVGEIPLPLTHRPTKRDPSGLQHRGRQAAALLAYELRSEARRLKRIRKARGRVVVKRF
jgi:glucosyl-3-phosphoglycerate synthase